MIKVNWGIKIALLYTSFVALVIVMVVMSMHQKIDLVSEDYYNKELAFQNQIDEMKNANALTSTITHAFTNSELELQFQPEFKSKKLTGEIVFFRPSDASKDFKTSIVLNEDGKQKIGLSNLSKGMYKMQISWKDEKTPYFSEETIVIP